MRNHHMKTITCVLLSFLLLPASHITAFAQSGSRITAVSLRCEYLVTPLAIDTREPRLSWMIESGARGAKQTAYQVIVASSASNLAADKGDLWDTSKVASSQTIQIAYQGKPLGSRQECF